MLSKKESISPESRDTKASKTTTIHRLNSRYRPQFFLLIVALLATCTVTVGVLGWQLTLGAAKGNIESLVQEMQDLVSNHISSYIREESMILQEITALQAKMFAADNWSLSTPERTNATLKNMLILLNTFKAHTMDMFYYTYPGGLNFGYYYPPEVPGQLRLWTSVGMTQYTWDCDALGNPQGPPVLTDTDEGDGTVSNPGHNNTLYNGPGGQAGSNLDYSNKTFQAFTNVYLWTGALFKSSYHISYNPVTKEQITFGNDWTMSFLAIKLTEILAKIPVPMFATILEVSSGTVVATSSDAKIISDDKKRVFSLFEIRDPFMQDFAGYINSMYPPLNNPPLQLGQIASRLAQMPKKSMDLHPRIYVDRVLNGTNWKIEMNTVRFGGGDYLFVTYLNVDAVEADVIQMSLQTGYMMLGIIIAFLMLGTLFATIVSRQLNLVARQIDLLKQLKFGEVLDKDSGIKGRSFVYELAALQESFHEMVTVFAQTIKKSSGLRTGQSSFGLNNGGGTQSNLSNYGKGSQQGMNREVATGEQSPGAALSRTTSLRVITKDGGPNTWAEIPPSVPVPLGNARTQSGVF